MPRKLVYDAAKKAHVEVELSPDEIAGIAQMQAGIAARDALPKPGEDLLALAEASRNHGDLKAVVIELIRRVFGLEAVPVEEAGEVLVESALSADEVDA